MIAIADCVEDRHCTVYRQVSIAGSTVAVQGLMLLSPAIDVPRTLLLRIMEMLQGLVLPFFPHWRIVPSPPMDAVTEDPKLVSPSSTGFDAPKGTTIYDPARSLSHQKSYGTCEALLSGYSVQQTVV